MKIEAFLTDFNDLKYSLEVTSIRISDYLKNRASSLILSVSTREIYPTTADTLEIYFDGVCQFKGKIYSYSKSKEGAEMLAFDTLRNFKSKMTGVYRNKKASQIFSDIGTKLGLKVESLDTSYVIPYLFFENKSCFEILEEALLQTKLMTGIEYVFCEEFDKIVLKKYENSGEIFEISDNVLMDDSLEVSNEDLINYVEVYQLTVDGIYAKYVEKDDELIKKFGIVSKSVKVNKSYTPSQCKLIAKNHLAEGVLQKKVRKIIVFAEKVIKSGDVFKVSGELYVVTEAILIINDKNKYYTLTLEYKGE